MNNIKGKSWDQRMKIEQKIEKVFPPLQADRKRVTRSSLGVIARAIKMQKR